MVSTFAHFLRFDLVKEGFRRCNTSSSSGLLAIPCFRPYCRVWYSSLSRVCDEIFQMMRLGCLLCLRRQIFLSGGLKISYGAASLLFLLPFRWLCWCCFKSFIFSYTSCLCIRSSRVRSLLHEKGVLEHVSMMSFFKVFSSSLLTVFRQGKTGMSNLRLNCD